MLKENVTKKDIPGYEWLYYATDKGEVWNKKKNCRLASSVGCVSLRKNGVNKSFWLDKLIYRMFVDPDYDNLHKIYHIDGDPNNYAASNLTSNSKIPNLPGETWRQFGKKHEVSSMGRARNIVKDTLCEVKSTNENCMKLVNVNSTTYRIDELVAKVFLGLKDGQCVYHKDGDIHNYVLDNLSLDPCISTEEGEEWIDVPEFEGRYMISTHGRVYSLLRKEHRGNQQVTKGGYFLDTPDDHDGYPRLTLVKQINPDDSSKTIRLDSPLHRFVAKVFIPNPKNLPQVNHIDGNKHNNHVDNLEWCTNLYNIQHSISTGLRDDAVLHNPKAIPTIVIGPDNVKHRFESMLQAAVYLSVDPELLRLYLHGKCKSCKGLDTLKYTVYKTTKDDFKDVVVEPHVRLSCK